MSSLNSSSSLGSGREGDGRNVVDPEKRTSITMLVLGDGELRFFVLRLMLRSERNMEGENSSPISFGNGKRQGKRIRLSKPLDFIHGALSRGSVIKIKENLMLTLLALAFIHCDLFQNSRGRGEVFLDIYLCFETLLRGRSRNYDEGTAATRSRKLLYHNNCRFTRRGCRPDLGRGKHGDHRNGGRYATNSNYGFDHRHRESQ